MKHGIAETLLLVGVLLLAIGSLMLVSSSLVAGPDCESKVSCDNILDKTSCNARATGLEDSKNRACIDNQSSG